MDMIKEKKVGRNGILRRRKILEGEEGERGEKIIRIGGIRKIVDGEEIKGIKGS